MFLLLNSSAKFGLQGEIENREISQADVSHTKSSLAVLAWFGTVEVSDLGLVCFRSLSCIQNFTHFNLIFKKDVLHYIIFHVLKKIEQNIFKFAFTEILVE